MVAEGALDDPKVEAVFGLHVGGWQETGQVGFAPGPFFASSDTFTITVDGHTVHGAQPHMGLDPIPIAAEIVQALQLIVTRQIDGRQPRVLSIGRIRGGTRFNIIAGEVVMDGTLRTHNATVRTEIKERMARTVKGIADAHGTNATLRFLGDGNPPTVNDPALAQMVRPALERVFGPAGVLDVEPLMVAEDFPYYGEKAPYFYFELGTRNEAKGIASVNHTATFDVDEDSWQILLIDQYDNRNQLWRVSEGHVINYYDVPTLWTALEVHTDLQTGRYLAIGLDNQYPPYDFDIKRTLADFTPDALRREGVR